MRADHRMTKTDYLKDSYKSRLYTVATFNVALLGVVGTFRAGFSMFWTLLSSISINDGNIGLITPIGAFVLDGLLSADAKARVVYWRCTHPLPGSRAFSVHLEKETRADPDRLVQQWGVFPDDLEEQNRHWYRICRVWRKRPPIVPITDKGGGNRLLEPRPKTPSVGEILNLYTRRSSSLRTRIRPSPTLLAILKNDFKNPLKPSWNSFLCFSPIAC